MENLTESTAGGRPMPLAPADEALLARAQTLREIADAALTDLAQPYPDSDPGRLLRDALFLAGLAERLVEQAAVAERERDTSWADLGEAAGVSKQTAHEKWSSRVGGWVLTGRRRTGIAMGPADPAVAAAHLDAWYAELLPDVPHAVSRNLASLHDVDARRQAAADRAEVPRLQQRLTDLRVEAGARYEAGFGAIGTAGYNAMCMATAAVHLAQAQVYERLSVVERPVAAEHHRSASSQRAIAQNVINDRTPDQSAATIGGTRERVYTTYRGLTDDQRADTKRAVAKLIADRLDGIAARTVHRHLDSVIETYARTRLGQVETSWPRIAAGMPEAPLLARLTPLTVIAGTVLLEAADRETQAALDSNDALRQRLITALNEQGVQAGPVMALATTLAGD